MFSPPFSSRRAGGRFHCLPVGRRNNILLYRSNISNMHKDAFNFSILEVGTVVVTELLVTPQGVGILRSKTCVSPFSTRSM